MRLPGRPLAVGGSVGSVYGLQALGRRLNPYMAYNFIVEIDGLLVGGFTKVSGLEGEVELESYAEGGVNGFVHQLPGRAKWPNIVLTHGLTNIDALWNWYQEVTRAVIRRKTGTIMLLDAKREPVMWWNFKDAFPSKWSGPTFDAGDGESVAVESIELVHRGLEKPALSQALNAAQGARNLVKG